MRRAWIWLKEYRFDRRAVSLAGMPPIMSDCADDFGVTEAAK
jgi:hypothetical protein